MSVLLDDREDRCLVTHLRPLGLHPIVTRLDYSDLMFEGLGPNDRPVLVAFERKTVTDVIQSMTSRRLVGHQLLGMQQTYDYCFLLIEGLWRRNPDDGGIDVWRSGKWETLYRYQRSADQGVTFAQLAAFLCSLQTLLDIHVIRTSMISETAGVYAAYYHWFQKHWSEHSTPALIYNPELGRQVNAGRLHFNIREPRLIESIAALLPGVDRKAWDVGLHFHSVREMLLATEADWQQIPGIGPTTAAKVVAALRQ